MTTNTTNSQAASIDTPEFWLLLNAREEGAMDDAHAEELEQAIVKFIDAKLAQAFNDGAIEGRIHQRGIDAARIDAAESRLAEIQRGVEGLTRWDYRWDSDICASEFGCYKDGGLIERKDVLALFAPQGQASDTVEMKG